MEKKIKVVFVLRFMLHYRIDLLERINSCDDIDLTLIYGRGIENSKFVNYEGETRFKNIKLKTLQYTRHKKFAVFFPSLFRNLIRLKPDVIIVEGESNMVNNIFVYLYSVLYNKKMGWWGLGQIPGTRPSIFQKLYKPLMRVFLRRTSFIIGYSEYSKNYYAQYTDINKIVVANNCLDNESIDKEIAEYRNEAMTLKATEVYKDKLVILYVGAFIPTKKVDKLLKAYHALKPNYPDMALVLVGDGIMRKELENMIETLNIQDVIFTGKVVNEVSKYFLLADLFVLPGLGGLSIHHAMTHSLPVISSSADGTERDLIVDNENGFILKTDTVEELTDRISRFLEDKTLASRFGKKSREIVDTKINIKNKVSTFHDVIVKAVKS
ncbi:MAG: glycosyltransferase [Bacteroidales bacterium]|nr:glycosyltransferase [Bacteroidales bacterium]